MEYLLLALVILAVPFVLPLALWVAVTRMRTRISGLERVIDDQRAAIERLVDVVARLRRDPVSSTSAGAAPLEPVEPVEPIGAVAPVEPIAAAPPPLAPGRVAAEVSPAPSREPDPVRPAPGPDTLPPPIPPAAPFDWENLIGVKLFSAIAGVALVFAAVFFLRYSVQQDWLQPPVRVLIGLLVAVALLVACERKEARLYPATANALAAAAVAILFATFFAAYALWSLVPAVVAFGLLGAVTALAVLLSIRRESLVIAVLGLLGGFATPALLSTGENRPVPLFAYLVLLNIGLAWVASRQVWPALTILTVVLTSAYQWVWVLRFLSISQLPLALGIFAVFPVVSVAALFLRPSRGATPPGGHTRTFERTAMVSAALPLAFVVYLSAVPAYAAHPGLLFGFLLFLDAGLLAVAAALGRPALHVIGALVTLLVWAAWLATGYQSGARELALGFTSAFVALYLAGPWVLARFSRSFEGADPALHAAPAMLFVFPVIAALDREAADAWRLFGPLLVLVLLCAWRAHALGRGAVFFIASFMAVAAQAVWSAVHLVPERLTAAVSVYVVFGLLMLSVPPLARRAGRPLQPAIGGAVVLIASLGLLLFLSQGAIAPVALWALALLLAILNAGIFLESASTRVPLLAHTGSVLSWILLAIWWTAAGGAVGIVASLTVLTGLTLVTLAGHAWAGRTAWRADPAGAGPGRAVVQAGFGRGLYLALTGHLFLLTVAINREWSLPPSPLFGALLVMTMGTTAAALSLGSTGLHVAGVGAAALVIAAWTAAAGIMPWTLTGLTASAVLSILALGLVATGVRPRAGVREAAIVALFSSEVTAILASAAQGPPPFGALLVIHLANLGAVLALATWAGWARIAMAAAVVAWAGLLELQIGHDLVLRWRELLLLTGTLYALFTAYPLIAGARMPDRREPWLAALIAAAMTFQAGRQALTAGGLGWMIGALPVGQGLVTAVLLRALLRLEPPGARDLTRLAIVAGVALAFVTVAIPLQLQHQWITIGWALEGAALAWLYSRVPHRGLLFACVSLLIVVFIRLTLNPAVWTYEPRGAMRIFNWYLYSYALSASAMLVAAWYLSGTRDRLAAALPRASQMLPAGAVILLFMLLNIQIADYYATGPEIIFRFGATVSQDLTYTIAWLAFGMVLLAVGIFAGSRPARIAAVALIAITTFKCFLYDLGSLEGLHRVASFVGLAIALALVSLALQKYVLVRPRPSS